MRKLIILLVALAAGIAFLCITMHHLKLSHATDPRVKADVAEPKRAHATREINLPSTSSSSPLERRKQMSKEERQAWLEENGEVPADGDHTDWQLAPRTSWWGQPLDPKVFWNGRVLWLDNSARMAARRHGRQYPPMPYEDTKFSDRSNTDLAWGGGADGPAFPFHLTDRERAFWDAFEKSHPIPPEEIVREQLTTADRMLGTSDWGADQKSNAEMRESIRAVPYTRFNYPQEAFTEDALFWSYVTDERQKYQNLIAEGNPEASPLVQTLVRHLDVATNYLTDPLPEAAQAANAWKIPYLQRLQAQNTDSSYINAYLQAWNIPASALSSSAK